MQLPLSKCTNLDVGSGDVVGNNVGMPWALPAALQIDSTSRALPLQTGVDPCDLYRLQKTPQPCCDNDASTSDASTNSGSPSPASRRRCKPRAPLPAGNLPSWLRERSQAPGPDCRQLQGQQTSATLRMRLRAQGAAVLGDLDNQATISHLAGTPPGLWASLPDPYMDAKLLHVAQGLQPFQVAPAAPGMAPSLLQMPFQSPPLGFVDHPEWQRLLGAQQLLPLPPGL